MLFLGVLSVFQLLLFPGLLLLRLIPAKRGFIQNSVYIFMLSLLANYMAVFILVSVRLYMRSVVLVLFAIEVALLFWLSRDSLSVSVDKWRGAIKTLISRHLKEHAKWANHDYLSARLYLIFEGVVIAGIVWLLWLWVSNFNTVFQTWDAWAEWDHWALSWADNHFPGNTWEYPQLIPAVYSVSYKFIGTTAVKFFGKSIMPLFSLMIVLMLFDLGRKYRSFGYMLGAGLALFSINLFLGKYIPEGYVDIPVACFTLMAVYSLLLIHQVRNKQELKSSLVLGSLAAASAAITKQPGLYILAFYPFLAYFWVLRGSKLFQRRDIFVFLAIFLLIVLLIVVPWYGLMEYRIFTGGNTSNIEYVTEEIYQGQAPTDRFLTAFDSLGSYIYFYYFVIISLLVLDNRFRQIVLFVILPFSILWAVYLSYEFRNLAIALPLLSMAVGISLEKWTGRIQSFFSKAGQIRIQAYAVVVVGLVFLGVSTLVINDSRIVQRQIAQQRQIFEPTLNYRLYDYFGEIGKLESIITSYPVGWLPELEHTWINERFKDYTSYQNKLIIFPEAELLLVPEAANPQIMEEIQQNITDGTYQVIFTESNYLFLRIPPR